MTARRPLVYLLFAGSFALSALVVAVIMDKPCEERVSECCRDGSCRKNGEGYGECYDRKAYFCPSECSC